LTSCPAPYMENLPLSAVRDCLFKIFAALLRIWKILWDESSGTLNYYQYVHFISVHLLYYYYYYYWYHCYLTVPCCKTCSSVSCWNHRLRNAGTQRSPDPIKLSRVVLQKISRSTSWKIIHSLRYRQLLATNLYHTFGLPVYRGVLRYTICFTHPSWNRLPFFRTDSRYTHSAHPSITTHSISVK
jgi:hypothetical protein